MTMKKTVWYIRQYPGNAVSVNLVESYEEQFDGVHIKYLERDTDDPLWSETVSEVVPMTDLAFSYTEAANMVRDILRDFNAHRDEYKRIEEEDDENFTYD